MMFCKCLLVLFSYFIFISAFPSSNENSKPDEHDSSKSMTSASDSTTPLPHSSVANSPIVPQVVYHNNQPLNTIQRVKRSVIKFDHRKHHENIYSIASGERGIRYIE